MSPRTEKQFEEIREERKAQIKKVALEIIYEEGYEGTSISKIAKRADISKGLLYNYYESKEEMIREIILDGFNPFLKVFDPDHDGVLTPDEVRYFIDEMFNILKSNLKYWRLYFSVMLQPRVMSLIAEDLQNMVGSISGILINYLRWKGTKNPEVEIRLILALLDGIAFHYLMDPKHFPIEAIKERIYKLILPEKTT
ncbi:MAG: TetR/AcrR family transcriptional regulator [Bacteroidales bacterium]|nr:TetR/AcrR family transcriptional regulator [Bacteroidales bacterium]